MGKDNSSNLLALIERTYNPTSILGAERYFLIVARNRNRKAEDEKKLIIRIFETTGEKRQTTIFIPYFDLTINIELDPFEIKSIAFDIERNQSYEVDLLERKLSAE